MHKTYRYLPLIIALWFTGCTDPWVDHYSTGERSVDVKMWDTLQTMEAYSEFVKYMRLFRLDTMIGSFNTKTLFIPDNESFNEYLTGDTTGFGEMMRYHITSTLFNVRNVDEKRKLRTLSGKYALIENYDNIYYFDGIELTDYSPLYQDGKFYEIDRVAIPKPSLYQYIERKNQAIHGYIEMLDSAILDKEKSKPLGFNEEGQTIYDSVTTEYNIYEEEYFAISEEFRDFAATLVIPGQENYENALNDMAMDLRGNFVTYDDIPAEWQNEVLIPILLHKGTYGGLLDPGDFMKEKITNVRGDSIIIDFEIDPNSRVVCSNGLVYDYSSFTIADTLYRRNIMEGESLVDSIGFNRYSWNLRKVTVEGDKSFQPVKQGVKSASNDTIINVDFLNNYQHEYAITFKIKHVFPQKFRLVWRTNYRTTGRYAIFVNGERILMGVVGYEEYDTFQLTGGFFSVLGYKLYPDEKGFCDVDGWVNNITDYGDVTITLKYLGPGGSSDNGLSMDYIALMPE